MGLFFSIENLGFFEAQISNLSNIPYENHWQGKGNAQFLVMYWSKELEIFKTCQKYIFVHDIAWKVWINKIKYFL